MLLPAGLAAPTASAAGSNEGGSITEVGPGIDPTIDPAFNSIGTTSDQPTLEAVYGPGLVYLDQNGKVQMGFAKSLTSKDNGHTWMLVLHSGLKFSDGTPFNAAAVAYNIARLADKSTGSTLEADAAQLTTKVLGATKLQITTTPTDAFFPQVMAEEFAMIGSPKALKAEGKSFGAHPVGPGPFKVQKQVLGISWTFVRNPDFASFAPGQPHLNSFTYLTEGSTSQLDSALQTGTGQTYNPENAQSVSQSKSLGLKVTTAPQPNLFGLSMNTSIPPFNNLKAREAVYDALDRNATGQVWDQGNPNSTNLFTPNSPYFDKKYNFPAQNQAKAQQLFNQLAAAGTPVKFSIVWPTSPTLGNVGSYVTGALSQFKNVTVTDDSVPTSQYLLKLRASAYQMTGGGLNDYAPSAYNGLDSKGSSNYGKFSDPKVDSALLKLRATTNVATQKKEWGIIEQEINKEVPVVPLQRGLQGFAYNAKEVGGVKLIQYAQTALLGPMYRINS